MAKTFDIVRWLGNKLGYDIPKATLEGIVMERGCDGITDFADLTQKDKDLMIADAAFYIYTCPNQTSSISQSHGDYTYSRGAQILTDKRHLYELMMSLYRKWGDPMAEDVEASEGSAQWLF